MTVEQAVLNAIKQDEEWLILKGLESRVSVFFDDEKRQQVCEIEELKEMAAQAAQGGKAMQDFLKVCEQLIVKGIAKDWRRRLESQQLAERISERLKQGHVPKGWTKQGDGWWKVPEGWMPSVEEEGAG